MCRDFSEQPLDPLLVDRLLDRARRAPSAGHTQGWAFVVLDDTGATQRFWRVNADADWLADPTLPGLLKAPVIVVPLGSEEAYHRRYAEDDKSGSAPLDVPYWLVDLSFSVMLLLLGAVAEGLGSLFFRLRPGAAGRLRDEFGVPEGWEPIGAVALGWPAGEGGPTGSAARRARRPLSEIVHRGGW